MQIELGHQPDIYVNKSLYLIKGNIEIKFSSRKRESFIIFLILNKGEIVDYKNALKKKPCHKQTNNQNLDSSDYLEYRTVPVF